MSDVIISGAGIIGLSLALELETRGIRVEVFDRAQPGQESSSAAAGMLAWSDPETPESLRELARRSAQAYPDFVARIEAASGMQTDFRQGAIALLESGVQAPANYRPLTRTELHQREPGLQAHSYSAFVIEEEHSVDPALLMRALIAAVRNLGIMVRSHTEVREIRWSRQRVEVITGQGTFSAGMAVNCQGAWSGAPVKPRKGQMLYLRPTQPGALRHVLRAPEVYLVPRTSGQILVGATVEDVGFDKTVVPRAIEELHRCAVRFVPGLAQAEVVSSWAGLRPGTPDGLPVLGAAGIPNVFLATGHFRNGILLAPVTARIMADLIAGNEPEIDLAPFSPARFAAARV